MIALWLAIGAAFSQEDAPEAVPGIAPALEAPAVAPVLEAPPVEAPAAPEPEVRRNAEGIQEIVVYGDAMVDKARRQLVYDLQQRGFTDIEDKGDYVRLRNEQAWKGEIELYDDGWIRMKRQPVHIESPDLPFAEEGSALAWASCVLYPPMCIKVGGQILSRRRWLGVQENTLDGVQDDTQVLGDSVADSAVEDRVNELPARLEALWTQGAPIQTGGAPLPTMGDRKAAILAYWDSRTDTVWGDRVRVAVEAFLRAEVQSSPWAFTAEEVATFNAGRSCERVFDLERDWEDVLAEMEP